MGRDLDRLEARIDQLKVKIADLDRLKSELAELESAARVLRKILGENSQPYTSEITHVSHDEQQLGEGPQEQAIGDLSGLTIRDAAQRVLKRADGIWMSYRDIANRAVEAGYTSGRSQIDPRTIRSSFLATLKRNPETFDRNGSMFKLKE